MMYYKTKDSIDQNTRVIVVPIEEIIPGIENRYRKMMDITRKEGRWPPKKTLDNQI